MPCTDCLDQCPFLTIDIDARLLVEDSGGSWAPRFQAATEEVQKTHSTMGWHATPELEGMSDVAKIVKERRSEMSEEERAKTREAKTELAGQQATNPSLRIRRHSER